MFAPIDEQTEVAGRIASADYRVSGLAGAEFARLTLRPCSELVKSVKDMWERSRTEDRSASLVRFIEAKINPLVRSRTHGLGDIAYRS